MKGERLQVEVMSTDCFEDGKIVHKYMAVRPVDGGQFVEFEVLLDEVAGRIVVGRHAWNDMARLVG